MTPYFEVDVSRKPLLSSLSFAPLTPRLTHTPLTQPAPNTSRRHHNRLQLPPLRLRNLGHP